MIKRFLPIISLLFILLSPAWADDKCLITPEQEKAFLAMNYYDFDQTPIGWRGKAKLGCYHPMGVVIDKYIEVNKATLEDWQRIAMTWHAGQMYAFNNEYDLARERFRASINPAETRNSPLRWNAYVNATIAFLDKNMAQLQFYKTEIEEGPLMNGKKANLNVVEQLIIHFDQPYSVAYCKSE